MRPRSLLVALLALSPATVAAQDPAARLDSARAQIQTTLRAFYFNLAHRDWEAMTAYILAAKVVAHRPPPESLARASHAADPKQCSSSSSALVDHAIVIFEADWAEVSVPRCTAMAVGADEFRLIRFESRWRFVAIELFHDPVMVSSDQ